MAGPSRYNRSPAATSRRRSPSPQPPQDIRRTKQSSSSATAASGIQIRGLARDHEEAQNPRESRSQPNRRDMARNKEDREEERYSEKRRPLSYSYSRSRSRSHSRSRSRSRSPPRAGRPARYHDRDRPSYRSPDKQARSRTPTPPRRGRSPSFGGPPSREIILDGLPADITEDDIKSELKAYRVVHLEDVRVIRNRSTGASRQFGFVRFPSINEAKAFLERNYPTIFLYGNASSNAQARSVRIAFSRERNDRDRERTGPKPNLDWTCTNCSMLNYARRTECLRCKLSRNEIEQPVEDDPEDVAEPYTNTGDSDVSPDSTPSQFLLFRSLEPSVTEEILAKGAAKLLRTDEEHSSATSNAKASGPKIVSTSTVAHAGARPDCIRRVLLVRDRHSEESWCYGFVEFAAVEDAQAALAKFNSLDKFTIASKPVMVTYIHAGVFVPVLKPSRDSRITFAASTNPDLRLSYWDQDAYVSMLIVSATEPQLQATSEDKNDPNASKSSTKSSKESDAKPKKRKAEGPAPGSSSGATKKMASHLQFWTDRHNELHGIDSTGSEAETDGKSSHPTAKVDNSSKAGVANRGADEAATEVLSGPAETYQQSYADPVRNCCYLCSRQFKTTAEVNKHERLSELHQKNLQDQELVNKAVARLKKAGVPAGMATTSEYRDRAKERRQAFNQPKQPGFTGSKLPAEPSSNTPAATSAVADANDENGPEDKPKATNKGASMLASMGYVQGQGLGAAGTGIQVPIAQDMYREGVGLGADGGKVGDAVVEAGRATRGDYNEFAEKTREKARERFNKIG